MIESSEDGNYLVRVRAQVMCRDDFTGGWAPLGGGAFGNVSVRKRPRTCPNAPDQETSESTSKPKYDYLICGRKITDNSIILSCTIKRDFEYNKVMPTFHHWKTEDKRYGLTFLTAADGRAFDKGVRTAVEDLLDGYANTTSSSSTPPPFKYSKDVGDDDVFMTLNLPQEPKDSHSSSDSSGKGVGGSNDNFRKMTYIGREKGLESRQGTYDSSKGENYQYVQLTAAHEYIYPTEDQSKPPLLCQGASESSCVKKLSSIELLPVCGVQQPPTLPLKHHRSLKKSPPKNLQPHQTCRHCHEMYAVDQNRKGACEYAPDMIKSTIDAISCIECAKCVCYHCAADAEGDFAQHPCDCTNDDNCSKRWLSLTFLSLLVPCLWLYPPLKMCHWCGTRCGICGGRHEM